MSDNPVTRADLDTLLDRIAHKISMHKSSTDSDTNRMLSYLTSINNMLKEQQAERKAQLVQENLEATVRRVVLEVLKGETVE